MSATQTVVALPDLFLAGPEELLEAIGALDALSRIAEARLAWMTKRDDPFGRAVAEQNLRALYETLPGWARFRTGDQP